eukprot:scaffold119879_cov28-Tisochrysis_lutea.AAC.3
MGCTRRDLCSLAFLSGQEIMVLVHLWFGEECGFWHIEHKVALVEFTRLASASLTGLAARPHAKKCRLGAR